MHLGVELEHCQLQLRLHKGIFPDRIFAFEDDFEYTLEGTVVVAIL
jgi:hypothetical protein